MRSAMQGPIPRLLRAAILAPALLLLGGGSAAPIPIPTGAAFWLFLNGGEPLNWEQPGDEG